MTEVQTASETVPSIRSALLELNCRTDEIVDSELARLTRRLPELDPGVRAEIARLVRQVADEVMRAPCRRLEELCGTGDDRRYVSALRELFTL